MPTNAAVDAPVPWWRVGVMWLVVGGLGVVIVASFALLATAIRHADVVLPHPAVSTEGAKAPGSPAMQSRNHSATPPK
ncbi:MAG: hypothetical protein H7Z19_18895 [Chitinophagaceae bacterium]|nr:hypothetical protein [Rubrivivax sp.]